jgi:peptide-N4-(N-acetyl-beta-glucosaminyl)asparagine amidase
METRSGRCGEWANVFTFMCYVIGVPVRYVWNSEDHVWTEVYSHAQERWVHVDACEGAFDKPLIYSDGWGKKMAYVIGFSTQGVMDVTKRYVRSSDKALPRSRVDESALESFLISLTAGIRGSYSLEFRLECQDRDELELVELVSYADGTPSTPANEIGPRESGKGEWTKVRGEDGTASS